MASWYSDVLSRCPDSWEDVCQSCHNPEGSSDWSRDWQGADSVRLLCQLCWPGSIAEFFSFLFPLLKNMFTSLCFFVCFSFGFLMVCALARFTGVNQVMLLISYPSGGVKEEKQCLPFAVHQRLGVNLLSSTCSFWYSSVHGVSAGRFTLLTGWTVFWLLGGEPLLSHFPPQKFICFLLLSVMSSLLENTPDNCSFSASSCTPC